MNPLFLTDGYKLSHHKMYPEGTENVYSNFTPRSNKHAPKGIDGKSIDSIVSFGQQMAVIYIHDMFKRSFFSRRKADVLAELEQEFSDYLGTAYDVSHFEALHDLGYLPIIVKSLPEGDLVPMGVPVLTIENTNKDFYWLPNYLETLLSQLLWKPMTSATIAFEYRKLFEFFVKKTDSKNIGFVPFMGHDFSARGLDPFTTITSGLGHLLSFTGSDSISAIKGGRKYYHQEGVIAMGVPASEHSVMCAGGAEDEIETFRRILKAYPTGVVSIVSDTWDLWHVCTNILPRLKDEIMARDGKVVIRPDSGNPADIICGFKGDCYQDEDGKWLMLEGDIEYPETVIKGVVELLYEVFGGTTSDEGYKVLDPHIGVIYGDSITITIAQDILERLEVKGFAATNVVLGIGSYTYQFNTRDSFGFAMKATNVTIKGVDTPIFKDPITDSGTKKSAKGLLCVGNDEDGTYKLIDQVSRRSSEIGWLRVIYQDGIFHNTEKLEQIKNRVSTNINNYAKPA